MIGLDVLEDALVVRDDERAHLGADEAVDAVRDDPQGVDVEARVGLVEHRDLRAQHRHLQDLEALLLAAGEPVVEVAARHRAVDLQQLHVLLQLLAELRDADGVVLAVRPALAVRVDGHAQEVRDGDAGNRVRVLEAEEETGARPLVRLQLEQVLAHEQDLALGGLVAGVAHQHVRERGLAGAVRPHDRVDLPARHLEVDAAQDLLVGVRDLGVQVPDDEVGQVRRSQSSVNSREVRPCSLDGPGCLYPRRPAPVTCGE